MASATATAPAPAPKGAIKSPTGKNPKEPKEPKAEKLPKQHVSATEEEIKAAVNGTLAFRDMRGSRDQAGLGEDQVGNGRPVGRPIGISSGLPIQLFWCYLFQENEKRAARWAKNKTNPKQDKPWTDEQISEMMKKEYPGRPNKTFENVNGARNCYNKGQPTRNIPPKIKSKRYDAQGNVDVSKRGAFGRKAAPATAPAAPGKSKAAPKGKATPPVVKTPEEPEEAEDVEEETAEA